MVAIKRMTLGGIESITGERIPVEIGETSIIESSWSYDITIRFPEEVRILKPIVAAANRAARKDEFLEFVEKTLEKNSWYLANAEYYPASDGIIFGRKNEISGRLYVGKGE